MLSVRMSPVHLTHIVEDLPVHVAQGFLVLNTITNEIL